MRDSPLYGSIIAAGICLGGLAAYALLRRQTSPDEAEFRRREMLVRQGRIIDGTIIDISDLSAEESGRSNGMQLILYKYEIAGVVYECSQDVTLLRHLVNIYDCRLGFPASVRYDPHNPGNSLVVAETWSGLRDTANSVPIQAPVQESAVLPALRSGGRPPERALAPSPLEPPPLEPTLEPTLDRPTDAASRSLG